jgi:hypothetical protein
MNNIVITTGEGSYHGPVTLVAWMLLHPWMTFFMWCALCSALEELFKASGKWGKHK